MEGLGHAGHRVDGEGQLPRLEAVAGLGLRHAAGEVTAGPGLAPLGCGKYLK